jgi:hypothetical protein
MDKACSRNGKNENYTKAISMEDIWVARIDNFKVGLKETACENASG